jgi:hypothetical protein
MINRDRIVFFNIAWMKQYSGDWINDVPVNGGSFIKDFHWGGEVYNFQPYNGMMYGYVEPGLVEKNGRQRNIDVSRLPRRPGALNNPSSVSEVLVVWVATPKGGTAPLVVGWYKDATLFRSAQIPPAGSIRTLPRHDHPGEYFASAREQDCVLISPEERALQLPRKGEGFGHSNLWYAQTAAGEFVKDSVLTYIQR